MNMTKNVQEALPEGFAFYSLGNLEVAPAGVRPEAGPELAELSEEALGELALVAFRYSGDARGVVITAFDRGLDLSIYTELGNILASRFADRLAALEDGVGISISPPIELPPERFAKMLKGTSQRRVERIYHHIAGQSRIPVRMVVLPDISRKGALHV
ncbi:MAG: chemotaxis protein CheC [Oligoflexia bacterium]|nr:chemotaxis protein CheC [Oligoflexia bacterium]